MNNQLSSNRRSSQRRIASIIVSTIAALSCVPHVWADDTEIFLAQRSSPGAKPNILLIVDSSSSMNTKVWSKPMYDASVDYAGDCDGSQLYWNDFEGRPSCSPSNTQRIAKTAYTCEAGSRMLEHIGSYAGVFAQHRDDDPQLSAGQSSGSRYWLGPEPGNFTDIVECQEDSGQHGDGRSGIVFAARGSTSDPFTSDSAAEIAWDSWPTSRSMTVYDGNYLNYRALETTEEILKINIVINVARAVLAAVDDVNIGLMQFNNYDGSTVISEIQDIDSSRPTFNAALNSMLPNGFTPLAESLFESALYWTGQPIMYGLHPDARRMDPGVVSALDPNVSAYRQPAVAACTRNFNVLLSDGEPRGDQDIPQLVEHLPGWQDTLGYSGCLDTGRRTPSGQNDGACARDIPAYLSNHDFSTIPGQQSVVTHAIGFDIDLPLLADIASVSGGKYLLADDVESLTTALLKLVREVRSEAVSFAAPAVTVNSFNKTQHLNELYFSTFKPTTNVRWPGNLKKYTLGADGKILDSAGKEAVDATTGLFKTTAASYWSSETDGNDALAGGALENLPTPASRRLFTNNSSSTALTASINSISIRNMSSFGLSDFGLTGSAAEPTLDELIRWARGEDVRDEDSDPSTLVRRAMGDPLHSQPAVVMYGESANQSPNTAVFMATNDGYLHAIDPENGKELWAFIPKELLPNLPRLFVNPDSHFKHYGIDGDLVPISFDKNSNGIIEPNDGDFVYLVFGMRRGGHSYYALDVTDKDRPQLLWKTSSPLFGQSWSKPTIAKIDMEDRRLNQHKAVVIVGGGYDTVHDTIGHPKSADARGAGVFFLDLVSGEILWRSGSDPDAQLQLSDMTRAIPSQIKAIDMTGDGYVNRMYAADLGGQLFRFDIALGKSPSGRGSDALVTGGVIAQLGAEGNNTSIADTRRFYNMPDASLFTDLANSQRVIALSIGSGYRAHPLDDRNSDRFYTIWDRQPFTRLSQSSYSSYDIVTDGDLLEVAGRVGGVPTSTHRGWKYTLPPNQKVLATSSTFDDAVYFVTFSAKSMATTNCTPSGGTNHLYRVAVATGDPVGNATSQLPGNDDHGRRSELSNNGIAPTPVFLFPAPPEDCVGQECRSPVVACVGVECFQPGFSNLPVRTAWKEKYNR